MKLAFIRRRFAATGGAELYLDRLLKVLADSGHELHVFAENWPGIWKAVTLHTVPLPGPRAVGPIQFSDAVKQKLAGQRFDCVFSLERTQGQDVYRAGDGVHRAWLQSRRRFSPIWKRAFVGLGAFHRNVLWLEAQTFDPANTRHVIVNSEMVKREILQYFDFPAERIHLVRNGVDVARFQGGDRTATRARFGVKDDEFLLLFVGSAWERKGLRYVLAAMRGIGHGVGLQAVAHGFHQGLQEFFKASRDVITMGWEAFRTRQSLRQRAPNPDEPPSIQADKVKLLVVGKGRRPFNIPSNVIFADTMTDVENAYAAADLFVFPPIYEPSANVVVEALAAGLPVVTSARNGASEIIEEDVNGSVIGDPSDVAGLLLAIAHWWRRRFYAPPVKVAELSLDRNVSETLAIQEMAAREKSK